MINYATRKDPEQIESLIDLRFDEAVFAVDSVEPERVIEILDEIAEFVSDYR